MCMFKIISQWKKAHMYTLIQICAYLCPPVRKLRQKVGDCLVHDCLVHDCHDCLWLWARIQCGQGLLGGIPMGSRFHSQTHKFEICPKTELGEGWLQCCYQVSPDTGEHCSHHFRHLAPHLRVLADSATKNVEKSWWLNSSERETLRGRREKTKMRCDRVDS